jgi:hypothetical protein
MCDWRGTFEKGPLMAMNRTQAGKLLSGREMELFESTLREQLCGANGKELHKRIGRVRTQRDRQSDLLRRQRVATRQRTQAHVSSRGRRSQGARDQKG